jgi:hypothetical protein
VRKTALLQYDSYINISDAYAGSYEVDMSARVLKGFRNVGGEVFAPNERRWALLSSCEAIISRRLYNRLLSFEDVSTDLRISPTVYLSLLSRQRQSDSVSTGPAAANPGIEFCVLSQLLNDE